MDVPSAGLLLISSKHCDESDADNTNDNVSVLALWVTRLSFGGPEFTFSSAAAAVQLHASVWAGEC